MSTWAEFYRWWITDDVTGEQVLTPYKLTVAHAALAFPGANPDLDSCEVRHLPELDVEGWGTTRPGDPWVDTKPLDDPRSGKKTGG